MKYLFLAKTGGTGETEPIQGMIRDLQIQSTNTGVKPTDVQVGSRYEETDTRKMYHYNENTPLIDESFASTPAMTWETNGGSSNMVYTVDTTTNHRAEQDSTGNSGFTHGTCIGDIGQTLSTNWVMRINLVHTGWESPDGGNQSINFWVSSKKQQTSGNADHAGLYLHTVSNSGEIRRWFRWCNIRNIFRNVRICH